MGEKIQMRFHRRMSPLKKIGIAFGVLIVLLIAFYFSFQLKQIEVEDCAYYTKEELLSYLQNEKSDYNTLFFYWKNRDNEEIDIPFIQKVSVEYVNRNSVKIRLYEKPIVGCIEYMNEYIFFDKDGKVLEISSNRVEDITLYSGINFSEMQLYDTLAVKDTAVFNKILDVSQLIDKYEIEVDSVSFDKDQNVTLVSGDIKVLLGNRTSYEEPISELVNIMPKIIGLKGELDMRNFTSGQDKTIFKEIKE